MTNDTKPQQTTDTTKPVVVKPKKRAKNEEVSNDGKRVRLRLIPIWLRVILVILLFVVVSAIGLMFGYGGLGDGDASDALKWSTWQHMIDIMKGVE